MMEKDWAGLGMLLGSKEQARGREKPGPSCVRKTGD